MNPENFCYWLQGYFELTHADRGLSDKQVEQIKDHLNLVFRKETPDYSTTGSKCITSFSNAEISRIWGIVSC